MAALLSTILAAACLGGCASRAAGAPPIEAGVLDLRGWDFDESPALSLSGPWLFLPGTVDISYEDFMAAGPAQRRVPDLWRGDDAGGPRGHGCGTYRLTVLLPGDHPPLALHYAYASTAFAVDAGGERILQVGVPSEDPRTARPEYRPGTVRLPPQGERLELLVRVSNYVYRSGGLWYPLYLGSAERVESDQRFDQAAALIQFTVLLLVGALLLLLYSLRRVDRSFLYGGLLTLVLALRVTVTGEYLLTAAFPGIPFALLIKLEYFAMTSGFFFGVVFFTTLYPDLLGSRLRAACLVPSVLFLLVILASPLDFMTRALFAYYGGMVFTLAVGAAALLRRVRSKIDEDALYVFAGVAVLSAAVVNDMLYSSFVLNTGNLAPWATIIFVCLQAVILVRRMTRAFAEAESLNERKDLLIKEIHHRVKNSLQVVSSLLTLQANRTSDPAGVAAYRALRSRVAAMSLVHEKLYGKVASETLDLGAYLEDLVRLIVEEGRHEGVDIRLDLALRTAETPVDACIDAGLITTELVSNALKHALVPAGGGTLRVELGEDGGGVWISVEDDGPGFPADFSLDYASTLGFKLVQAILRRSRGRLELLPGPGGRVKVYFSPGPAQQP